MVFLANENENRTRHLDDCRRVFRRYDLRCPRCRELATGAEPRPGWTRPQPRDYPHDCQTARCGPICTYGDW